MTPSPRQAPATSVARELLDQAIALMDHPSPATAGLWPRASALLARQALEVALKTYWSKVAPGVEESSTRAQILCLHGYLQPEPVRAAAHAWDELSRACHHRAGDLAATRDELGRWCASVAVFLPVIETARQP